MTDLFADAPRIDAAGRSVPVLSANTVVVGTGSAGYCAADRLHGFGQESVLVITDKRRAGASRNAGSDKQTYYKLTLSGGDDDSVYAMAETLFSGGAMDGDIALAEAANSARAFLHLVEAGVPFPQNRSGEFVGYKTDHDPRRRATSVGPFTSKSMTERLEERVEAQGTPILQSLRVVEVLRATDPESGEERCVGLLCLRTDQHDDADRFALIRTRNVVYATGGPAGIYADAVYPNGQWGANGAALAAGIAGENLTEWQFGLASVHPKWNVSGTYMQVIPRFISTDADGNDEREFLVEALNPDGSDEGYGRLMSLVFLKGYQWPFDVRKAVDGSSLIDLIVYRERVLRGRRVWLDYRSNPVREDFDPSHLSEEAYAYLERAGCLFGTPIERLQHMNNPAYEFYLGRNPRVDLATEMLEVAVCAQHNNGGLAVNDWWETSLAGFFAVGEAAGAHGVYRPGGAALNSGQVGATRAAQFIAAQRTGDAPGAEVYDEVAAAAVERAYGLLDGATSRVSEGGEDTTDPMIKQARQLMSTEAAAVRSPESVRRAHDQVKEWLETYADTIAADPTSRRSVDRVFLVRDILQTQYVYLAAMLDYLDHGGRSRGAVLYTDPAGEQPGGEEMGLPELFQLSLDGGALDGEKQSVTYRDGQVECQWRPVRPIPADDDFFENVWRSFREHGNIV